MAVDPKANARFRAQKDIALAIGTPVILEGTGYSVTAVSRNKITLQPAGEVKRQLGPGKFVWMKDAMFRVLSGSKDSLVLVQS